MIKQGRGIENGDWNMIAAHGSGRVRFETPDPADLFRRGIAAVDMHCHTNHSDSPVSVRDALCRAQSMRIGIAITDHNQVSGTIEAARLAPSAFIIPGIEVSAIDGPHILLYFYSHEDLLDFYKTCIEKDKGKSPYLAIRASTSEILERASGYPCISSAAHPYGYLLFNKGIGRCIERDYLPQDLIPGFDALEVISGGMPRSKNIKALQLALKWRRGFTGGTDAHMVRDFGKVLTCAVADSVDEFLEAIVKNRNFIVGQEKSLFGKSLMGAVIAPRYLPYLYPSLAIHYQQNIPRIRRFLREGHRKSRE